MPYKSSYRVYYEDTDAGGVVYNANYLKFAERARTDMFRDVGVELSTLKEKEGLIFVIRHVALDLLKAAKLDNIIDITTSLQAIQGASIKFEQLFHVDGEHISSVVVKVACVNHNDFSPTRIPLWVREKVVG